MDGDGTVSTASALALPPSKNVRAIWLNLYNYDRDTGTSNIHATIFNAVPLQQFISSTISGKDDALPQYMSSIKSPDVAPRKKFFLFVHSPLTLQLTDSNGNATGAAANGTITQNIPNATYGQFGEVQYIIAPASDSYTLDMHGTASGTFSLDIDEGIGDKMTATSTIANVPVATSTTAHLTFSNSISSVSPLSLDEDGDGKTDFNIQAEVGTTTTFDMAIDPLKYIDYMQRSIKGMELDRRTERQVQVHLDSVKRLIKLNARFNTIESNHSGKKAEKFFHFNRSCMELF